MAGEEIHHCVPRCLLRLHDAVHGDPGERVELWVEFEHEATRWGVPVTVARGDLEELVVRSAVVLEREAHRLIHETDWQRWGRRGGRAVLRRYGTDWFAALALKRWGRIDAEDLDAMREVLR